MSGNRESEQVFLKVQIGPVQEFIAQARSTRDLWSGSYLLSWLMAAGMHALVKKLVERGCKRKDALNDVIFPSLAGQPLMQWLEDGTGDHHQILTPNIPNLFVARVPSGAASELATAVVGAIKDEWGKIHRTCWEGFSGRFPSVEAAGERFAQQAARFPQVAWCVTPAFANVADAVKATESIPGATALDFKSRYDDLARKLRDEHSEDAAYAMGVLYNAWTLDAVRQARTFDGWSAGGWTTGAEQEKDSLTGREETIFGGAGEWSETIARLRGNVPGDDSWRALFRERHKGDYLGALTLVKRIWPVLYLGKDVDGKPSLAAGLRDFPVPSTYDIAMGNPDKADIGEKEPGEGAEGNEHYFAVLALDGDQVGQWVSGAKLPKPVSDKYHRTLGKLLTNFAMKAVRPIVEDHRGFLIYSGGDDVLAMLPADTALDCARLLAAAFAGKSDPDLATIIPGWEELRREMPGAMKEKFDAFDALTASVGVAIAHFQAPLQDVVHAAEAAQKRAKRPVERGGGDRDAIAVSLFKRSGEINEWTCRWNSGGLELAQRILDGLEKEIFSGRFPHALHGAVKPYACPDRIGGLEGVTGFDAARTISAEFGVLLDRAVGSASAEERGRFLRPEPAASSPGASALLDSYCTSVLASHPGKDGGDTKLQSPDQTLIDSILGLASTVAFIHKGRRPASNGHSSP